MNDVQSSMDKHLRLMEVAKDEEFSKATDAYFTEVGMDNIFIRGIDYSLDSSDRKEFLRSMRKIVRNLDKAAANPDINKAFTYNDEQS